MIARNWRTLVMIALVSAGSFVVLFQLSKRLR